MTNGPGQLPVSVTPPEWLAETAEEAVLVVQSVLGGAETLHPHWVRLQVSSDAGPLTVILPRAALHRLGLLSLRLSEAPDERGRSGVAPDQLLATLEADGTSRMTLEIDGVSATLRLDQSQTRALRNILTGTR